MKWSKFAPVTKSIRTKTLSLSAAFLLTVTSLSGATPLFTKTVFAAGATSVCASGCDYTNIQDAIDNIDAGGTVNVAAGTYSGSNINVNKSVTINGAPGAEVVVPNVTETNGFNVRANDVTIEGLSIIGPASSSYLTYPWGSINTRGIVVHNGVTNFAITGNTIQNLRNNILIDGRNTGSVTNNTIDNSKSGISVQYTDAGAGNSEGYDVTIAGNHEGTYGNEWGLNTHLNGHYDSDLGTLVGNSVKIAAVAPGTVQQALLANSSANNGWTVQDQGYSTSNRTAVSVATTGSDSAQGSPLGPVATIPYGITAVVDGGKVNVKSGTYNVTSANNVNKKVDIEGQSGATITTSGGAQIFTFTAAGSKLNGFAINKTDKTSQNIVGIQANNTTISHNTFSGQYVANDNEVARALEISTTTGSTISDNTINALRQPAYINDNATGQINNNSVDGTKGWVLVANSNFSFNGNTWGTNATDIAIIDNDGNPATPVTNNYPCSVMDTIKANNSNASIDNQVLTSPCPILVGAPNNLKWLNHDGDTLGAYTNVNLVTPAWSAPSSGTVDHYEYSFTSPTNSNWSTPEPFSNTSIPDQVFDGAGNNGTEGPWQFRVRAVSPTNNTSDWIESPTITYDKTAPTGLAHVSPANGTVGTTANLTSIHWTDASDAHGPITYYYESSMSSSINSDDSFVSPVYQSGVLSDNQIPTPNTPEGTYYWHVRAVDAAGNKTAWTDAWEVVVDNTPAAVPTASFTQNSDNHSVANGGYTDSQYFTFHLTSSGVARYQLKYWNDIPGSPFNGQANAWSPTDLSGYSTSPGTYVDNFTQGEGTHHFAFSACDEAGNCSAFSSPFTVIYDKTAPTTPSLSSPSNNGYETAHDFNFDWTDSTDANAPLQYKWEASYSAATNTTDGGFQNVLASHTLSTSEVASPGTPDGTYYWHVRAIDPAGNTSNWTPTWKVTVDTNAPSAPEATPAAGDYTTTQLVSLTSNGSDSMYYTTDGSVPNNTGNGSLYTGAISVSSDQTIKAIAYDEAGNASPVLTAAYTITEPVAPTTNTTSSDNTTPPITTFGSLVQGGGATGNTNAGAGNTGNAGGAAAAGAAANGGQVLGANTNTPNADGTDGSSNGRVKGTATELTTPKEATKSSSNFLGLGWWWLLVLGVIGLFYALVMRRADGTDKSS
jgi:hypothetical protein